MEQNVKADVRIGASPLDNLVDSAALSRLLEEVRNEDASVARSYDRTHNRHNR
ncbi:YhhA family cyclophane-containing RiPP [Sphingomonas sp. MMS24-JH45]